MDLNLHSLTLFWWSPITAIGGAALIFLKASIAARRHSEISPRLSPYILGLVLSGVTLALVGVAIAMFAYCQGMEGAQCGLIGWLVGAPLGFSVGVLLFALRWLVWTNKKPARDRSAPN